MREMEERIQTYENDLPQIVNRVLIRAYFQRNCMMPRKEILKRSQNCVWYSHRTENLNHSHQPYWATQHSSATGQRPQEFCLTQGNTQFQTDLPKNHKSKVQNMKVITSHLTVHQNKSQDSQECQKSQFPQNKTLTMSDIQRIPSMQRSRKIYPIRRKIINQSKLIQILNYREDIKIVIMTLLHKSS